MVQALRCDEAEARQVPGSDTIEGETRNENYPPLAGSYRGIRIGAVAASHDRKGPSFRGQVALGRWSQIATTSAKETGDERKRCVDPCRRARCSNTAPPRPARDDRCRSGGELWRYHRPAERAGSSQRRPDPGRFCVPALPGGEAGGDRKLRSPSQAEILLRPAPCVHGAWRGHVGQRAQQQASRRGQRANRARVHPHARGDWRASRPGAQGGGAGEEVR